jgi:hypothetical protein
VNRVTEQDFKEYMRLDNLLEQRALSVWKEYAEITCLTFYMSCGSSSSRVEREVW